MTHSSNEVTERALYDAVAKLIKAKGRFHTEQNYAALVKAFDACATTAAIPRTSAEAVPDPAILAARAEGRAEAVQIIMEMDAESALEDCTVWCKSGAPEDEGGSHWDEVKLRELFSCDDKLFNLYQRAEGMYWEALGKSDEADRMMSMVKQAPTFKPLHDFLAKHEAWSLMHSLQTDRATPAPADSAAERDARLTTQGMADCMDMVRGELIEAGIIDKSVPPMMIANAVCARLAEAERDAT